MDIVDSLGNNGDFMNLLYNSSLSSRENKEIRRIARGKSYTFSFIAKRILRYALVGLLSYSSYQCSRGINLPELSSEESGLELVIQNEECGDNVREVDSRTTYGFRL